MCGTPGIDVGHFMQWLGLLRPNALLLKPRTGGLKWALI